MFAGIEKITQNLPKSIEYCFLLRGIMTGKLIVAANFNIYLYII